MGCGSCGTSKPGGCKSNGGCSTGGCNRLNVHDWLMNLPIADADGSCKVVEVSFKQGSRKEFYRNTTLQYFDKGDYVTVEGIGGFDVGEISLTGEMVRLQMKKKSVDEFGTEMKKILRRSTDRDLESYRISKDREPSVQAKSREFARNLNLQMKLSEVEIQADGKKATFFYTADDRVDFRELIKQLAGDFKLKVEMRQIGIRQEAAKVGGIGSCGRELCCSTWLNDFKSVNTTAARYQNLSINQTKLSGQCGRLKCCLNYELDTYLDALQHFPDNADSFETSKGTAYLIKKDIFKNLMWYIIQGGSKHYPLTIQRVKDIKRLNAQGIKPEELEPVDVTTGKPKEIEPQFVDVVGQISLKSLERNDKRRKDQQRDNRNQESRNQDSRNQDTRQQDSRQQGTRNQEPRQQDSRQQGTRNQGPRNQEPRQQDSRQQGPRNQDNRNRPQQQGGQQQRQQQQSGQQQRPIQQRPPQNRPLMNRPPQPPIEDKKDQ